MEIMPVATCCKLHAHNYTCIQKHLGRRGTLDPTGQLVQIVSPCCTYVSIVMRAAFADISVALITLLKLKRFLSYDVASIFDM